MAKTAASFEIQLGPGLKEFEYYVHRLARGGLRRIARAAAYDSARAAARLVKAGYASADYERQPGTLAQYFFGGGGSKRWRGAEPLRRSKTLMNSVVVRKATLTGAPSYIVQIHPTKTYTRGDPKDSGKSVAQIANQLENPKPVVVRVTKRMLRYLHWLDRKAGRGVVGNPAGSGATKIGGYIIYTPTGKPVWLKVKRELRKLRGPLARSIQRRLYVFRYNPRRAASMQIDLM